MLTGHACPRRGRGEGDHSESWAEPSAGEGRPLTHFSCCPLPWGRRPILGGNANREGCTARGVGGRPLPTLSRDPGARGVRGPRGRPVLEQPRAGSRVPPNLRHVQGSPGPPPGSLAPQPPSGGKRRLRRGRSSKQLQRPGLASERAPLPRPCRRPAGSPAVPGAALSRTRSTRRESRPLPGWLWRLLKRPGQRRTGKSGLTCHYFLRHLGSTCQRPHKALWVRKSL